MIIRRLSILTGALILLIAPATAALEDDVFAVRDTDDSILGYIDDEDQILDTDREVIGYIYSDCLKDDDYIILAYREQDGEEERLKNTSYRTEYYLETEDEYSGELSDKTFDTVALWDSGKITDSYLTPLAYYEWDNPDTEEDEGLTGQQALYFLLYFTDFFED
ncbi:MAG: hypothetical protein GF403_10790 [Candidatus Coatesbacteria bacterium]|nr:hypothetical protein [Candidatus Coatesbacteria bacterium]